MKRVLPPLERPNGDTWDIPANKNPPTTVVMPHSVLAALLACLDEHPEGASLEACEAAVQRTVIARRLKGDHPVLRLMCWAAPNRGIGFACRNGIVTCTRVRP
jgi:hypothetical protein